MSLDIHLSMDETALAPFRAAWDRASIDTPPVAELSAGARAHHAELDARSVPGYLRGHVDLIPEIADLLADSDWQIDDKARRDLSGALAYFNDPSDLIPDSHPKFGLLDDAIVIELALSENRMEWLAWQEFAALRRCHAGLGPMNRQRWASLRAELPRLIAAARSHGSYVTSQFTSGNGRSRYRMLADLPRLDMQ